MANNSMQEILSRIEDINALRGGINAEEKAQVIYELVRVLKSYSHDLRLYSMVPGFRLNQNDAVAQ